LVQTDEERKAKKKLYNQSPERKAKKKEYNQRPEAKAKNSEYHSRPENKAKKKERQQRPENVAKRKEYNDRPEVKAKRKEHNQKYKNRPGEKARVKIYRDTMRVKVLQYYSKHLSKSNISCCNCCGENSYIEFLAVDHIAGRHQMDSEPELVKLGYSSKMQSSVLLKWIIDNNFPKGFQILCHNCNLAKGHSKDNKCPMENKPH